MFYRQKTTAYETHTRIVMGIDCINQLPAEIADQKASRILVLSDPGVSSTAFFAKCLDYIKQACNEVLLYTEIEEEAPLRNVEKARSIVEQNGCDLMIAIGGGSTIDVTKGAAVLVTNGGKARDWAGYEKFSLPPVPFFTIPTTAGTSSEVTSVAVLHDEEDNLKFTIGHRTLECAKVTFLDGQCLASCPRKVIAQSGIDALSHSFESYISLKANPMTEALSLQGISLITKNLRAVYANQDNSFAALDLLIGSTLGGMAFTTTGCGHMHCIGRHVGPKFHLSHGGSIAVVMPAVARFNFPAQMEKYREIARVMDLDISSVPLQDVGEIVVAALKQLIRDVGITVSLADLNPTQQQFEELADECMIAYKAHYHEKNPRKTRREDFIAILQDCC